MTQPHLNVSAAIIFSDERNRILIAKRKPEGLHGGLWEFPGGKIEPGETPETCIRREIREELGITISHVIPYQTVSHAYVPFSITLHVFTCLIGGGTPRPLVCEAIRWVKIETLDILPFPAADKKIIAQLLNEFSPDSRAFPITDSLDLHTFQPGEVKPLLQDYLILCREKGFSEVRIIHGKGTGTLKRIVQGILKKSPLVKAHYDAPETAGGWGATLVEILPPERPLTSS
jgi:A/G-specific adenine glycosylase